MDQQKTETPTGDAADRYVRMHQRDKEAFKKLEDKLRLKQLTQIDKKVKEQAKKDAVTEAEAILYAPNAVEKPIIDLPKVVAQKETADTELKEDKDAALIEANRILNESKTASPVNDPQQETRKHFKGIYSNDLSVASFHLKKLQSLLASEVEIPNREQIEEQARLRAKEIYLKKMGEKDPEQPS